MFRQLVWQEHEWPKHVAGFHVINLHSYIFGLFKNFV